MSMPAQAPLWRIFPSADAEDPRWQGRSIWREILVRAPSASLARLIAGRSREAASAGPRMGNESPGARGLFGDEKLYRVTRLAESGAIVGDDPASAAEVGLVAGGNRQPEPPDALSWTTPGDVMQRTLRKTFRFPRPFPVIGIEALQPAGTYSVEIEEERLEGLSFVAYRRCSASIVLPPQPGHPSVSQVAQIDPGELELALDEAP